MSEKIKVIRENAPIESVPYGESVIPQNRLDYLSEKCEDTLRRIPGNVLEVGVYKGGSIIQLAKVLKQVCPEYKVYGIDTFSGHPYSDGHPIHPEGKYSDVNLTELRNFLSEIELDSHIHLFQGKVEEIFNALKLEDVSFTHIDCDLYLPVKFCADSIPLVMKQQSVMYFDDYGHEHCPGATKAVNDTFKRHRISEVYMTDDNTCWSCVVHIG